MHKPVDPPLSNKRWLVARYPSAGFSLIHTLASHAPQYHVLWGFCCPDNTPFERWVAGVMEDLVGRGAWSKKNA
ncbi:hypothetical protein SD81_007345 [Tolypothrix campylonemoides VB511288]|nr:hypothetical protein SD81_007345 [Tolypothrix campylonemoides VB511288]